MIKERAQASFKSREMTFYMDGGEALTKMRESMMLEFERDPTFRMDDVHDLTRPEIRERIMTRVRE